MDTPTQISLNQVIVGTDYDDALSVDARDNLGTWKNNDGSEIIEDKAYDINQFNDTVEQNDNFEFRNLWESAAFLDFNLRNFPLDLDKVEQSFETNSDEDNALTVQDLTSTDVPAVVLDGGDSDDIFDVSQNYVDVLTWSGYEKDSLTGSYHNDFLDVGYDKDTLTGSNL